jgi:hypothetical protein
MAVGDKPRRIEVYFVPPPGDGLYKPVEYFQRWIKVGSGLMELCTEATNNNNNNN